VTNNTQYCVASPNISIVNNPTAGSAISCAAEAAQQKTFTSTFEGLRKIAQNEGTLTLWRGLSPTLLMAVPANVIYFAGYDWLRYNKSSPFKKMSDAYVPLAAGSSARILAAIAVSPIEMFRTRMQAAHATGDKGGTFRATWQGLREMTGAKGYRSLWTGLGLTLWRDVPFSAIYWWGYEFCRNELTDLREQARGRERISGDEDATRLRTRSRSRENHTTTLIDSFIAGATSGAVAALVTTPFDVGKTRQQVFQYAQTASTVARPEELSMPRFLWFIFKEQGIPGLFRGWTARCLKVAPACAIMISSYEIGKKMAGNYQKEKAAEKL
jgi:solute carrier family 25 protein 39/40